MVKESLDAFVGRDTQLARRSARGRRGGLAEGADLRSFLTYMMSDPKTIPRRSG